MGCSASKVYPDKQPVSDNLNVLKREFYEDRVIDISNSNFRLYNPGKI